MDKDGNKLNYINNAATKIIFNQELSEITKEIRPMDQIARHSLVKQ
jgi:hypothetical protein